MVVYRHQDLSLPVVIVERRAQRALGPARDLRVERLARAARDAKLAGDRRHRLVAGGHHQPVRGRRRRHVVNALRLDHAHGSFDVEAALEKRNGVAQQQRPDDSEGQAVGPSRVGHVPVAVLRSEIDRRAHVERDVEEHAERPADGLRVSGGSRGEENDKRVVAAQHDGFRVRRLRGERGVEVASDEERRRAVFELVELQPVSLVGHDELRVAPAPRDDAARDRRRAEGGEQRLVDRADPPGAEGHDQELWDARQETADHVALSERSRLANWADWSLSDRNVTVFSVKSLLIQ